MDMKIAIYNNFSIYDTFERVGGVEVTMDVYAQEMTRQGHEVFMIVDRHLKFQKREEIVGNGYKIYRIGNAPRKVDYAVTRFMILIPLARKLKELKPDVLLISKFSDVGIGVFAGNMMGVPVVALAHDIYDAFGGRYPFRFVNQLNCLLFYKSLSEAIPVNGYIKGRMEDKSKMKNLSVCYTGFNINNKAIKNTYRNYESVGKPFTFLFMSRMQKEKGIFDLADCFRQFMEYYPNSKCVFIGQGVHLEEFKETNKDLIDKGKIEVCGYLQDEDMFTKMIDADLFIMPTKIYEGIVFANVMAMKLGLPIITANGGAITEVVKDHINGIVYERNDNSKLLSYMIMMAKDKVLAEELAKNALETAKKFSAEESTNELMKHLIIYEKEG
jgi:glycosyltransferase involved in cell wall biosynthesis